jgi:hypothetical protein
MTMKAEELFGVGVRLFGVWCGIYAIFNLAYFIDMRVAAFRLRNVDRDSADAYAYLAYTFINVGLAYYFLVKTKHLTEFTYRHWGDDSNPPKPD